MDPSETANKTWNSGYHRVEHIETQFFQNATQLGPFAWICLAIIFGVETMCLFLISSTLVLIWSKRTGLKKVVRRTVDRVLRIRPKESSSEDSSNTSGTQEVKESSAETDSESFFTAENSEFAQDKEVEVGSSLMARLPSHPGTAVKSCLCCKIRGVLTVICGSKFGSGDCFLKAPASGSSTTAFDQETETLLGEGEQVKVKRCRCFRASVQAND